DAPGLRRAGAADRSGGRVARHDGARRRRPLMRPRTRCCVAVILVGLVAVISGCGWRGLNSFPLPGTEGGGDGSFTIAAQMPDVDTIQPNSRVRVGDVTLGTGTPTE